MQFAICDSLHKLRVGPVSEAVASQFITMASEYLTLQPWSATAEAVATLTLLQWIQNGHRAALLNATAKKLQETHKAEQKPRVTSISISSLELILHRSDYVAGDHIYPLILDILSQADPGEDLIHFLQKYTHAVENESD